MLRRTVENSNVKVRCSYINSCADKISFDWLHKQSWINLWSDSWTSLEVNVRWFHLCLSYVTLDWQNLLLHLGRILHCNCITLPLIIKYSQNRLLQAPVYNDKNLPNCLLVSDILRIFFLGYNEQKPGYKKRVLPVSLS